ncbi:TPA_asm: protein 2 [Ranunculus virus 1]|uniref:Protein 2 n=1 Tax=Ranunculus virus 1 TaxID=2977983 RepID=A0A9N6YJD8_9RHAB|nr:TPA_asm: protein 2 [Ranunculus virus 1]
MQQSSFPDILPKDFSDIVERGGHIMSEAGDLFDETKVLDGSYEDSEDEQTPVEGSPEDASDSEENSDNAYEEDAPPDMNTTRAKGKAAVVGHQETPDPNDELTKDMRNIEEQGLRNMLEEDLHSVIAETQLKMDSDDPNQIRENLLGSGSTPQMLTKQMEQFTSRLNEGLYTSHKKLEQEAEYAFETIASESLRRNEGHEVTMKRWLKKLHRTFPSKVEKTFFDVLKNHPEITIANLKWILMGWDLRGDHNVVEIKNAVTAINEQTHRQISSLDQFNKKAGNLIDGFQSAMKDMIETATEKKTMIKVPSKVSKSTKSKASLSATPSVISDAWVNFTKKGDLEKVKKLVELSGLSLSQIKEIVPGKEYINVLLNLVHEMTEDEDWRTADTESGHRLLQTDILAGLKATKESLESDVTRQVPSKEKPPKSSKSKSQKTSK